MQLILASVLPRVMGHCFLASPLPSQGFVNKQLGQAYLPWSKPTLGAYAAERLSQFHRIPFEGEPGYLS